MAKNNKLKTGNKPVPGVGLPKVTDKLPPGVAGLMQRQKTWADLPEDAQELLEKVKSIGIRSTLPTNYQTVAQVRFWSDRTRELLQLKGNLDDDEIEYLHKCLGTMKDEKLKNIIAGLIGWGDDERGELETLCAIALEVMAYTPLTIMEQAFRRIELRSLIDNTPIHKPTPEQIEAYDIKTGLYGKDELVVNPKDQV